MQIPTAAASVINARTTTIFDSLDLTWQQFKIYINNIKKSNEAKKCLCVIYDIDFYVLDLLHTYDKYTGEKLGWHAGGRAGEWIDKWWEDLT